MAGTKISQLTEDAIVAGDTVAIRRGASNYAGTIGDQIAAIETITAQLQTTGTAAAFSINTDSDNNATGATADLLFDNNGGTTVARLRWDEATSTFNLGYGASNHLVIDSSGNVGIGTPSPDLFTVSGGDIRITGSTSPGLRLFADGLSGFSQIRTNASGHLVMEADPADVDANSLINFSVDNVERMRIDSSGKLGLGTTSPDDLLDIVGSIAAPGPTTDNLIRLSNENAAATATAKMMMRTHQGDGTRDRAILVAGKYGSTGGYLSFWTRPNGSTITEKIRINGDGNLHIGGTTAPNKFTVTHDEAVTTWSNVGDASTDAVVKILGSNNATPYGIYMGYANSANDAQGIQAGDGTSALPLLLNPMGGDVAIGKNSATYPLDVDCGTAGPFFARISTDYASAPAYLAIRNSATANASNEVGFDARLNTSTTERTAWRVSGGWTTITDASRVASLKFAVAGNSTINNVLTLAGSGDVGVGTSAPIRKLHVSDAGNVYAAFSRTGATASALVVGAESGKNRIYSWTTPGGSTASPLEIVMGATTAFAIDSSGDVDITTGDLLIGGEIYNNYAGISVDSNATTTTFGGSSTDFSSKSQVTVFDTNEASNGATPDHTNDHITISGAGDYEITLNVSFSGGANDTISMAFFINNGATQKGARMTRKLGTGGDVGSASLTTIATLADADTLELWAQNESATAAITVQDASLLLKRVG